MCSAVFRCIIGAAVQGIVVVLSYFLVVIGTVM